MNKIEKKLYDFNYEMSNLLNDEDLNKTFRYQTLLLIKKHFGFRFLSFVVHENSYKKGECINFLDNITLGISSEALNEYYRKYQFSDPFYDFKSDLIVVDMFDIIPEDMFIKTDYYTQFYSKSDMYYQIISYIKDGDKTLAHLLFGKAKEEGPFTKNERMIIEEINKIVTIEFIKANNFKKLFLEVSVLKETINEFPIGYIVMNADYDITYYNENAANYVNELTGTTIDYFKYFFVNEILGKKNLIKDLDGKLIEKGDYIFKINQQNNVSKTIGINNYNYIIYVLKRFRIDDLEKRKSSNLNLLTKREKEVAHLIRIGYTNKEIAAALEISTFTVKAHIQKIYEKVGANNRIHLINKLFIEY